MTTLLEPETLLDVDWGSLIPDCEAFVCNPKNPGELAVEVRHFDPSTCENERAKYWICRPCYEYITSMPATCQACDKPGSIYIIGD